MGQRAENAKTLAVAGRIGEILGARSGENPSLGAGEAGVALFEASLRSARGKPPGRAVAARLIRAADQAISHPSLSLHEGLPGIAFAAQVIYPGRMPRELRHFGDEVDALLLRAVGSEHAWPWETMDGLTGMTLYALERRPHRIARELPALIVQRATKTLKEVRRLRCIPLLDPVTSGLVERFPQVTVDLGVAHGTLGFVHLLALLVRHARDGKALRSELSRLIGDLLALPKGPAGAWPRALGPRGKALGSTRPAWCSGTLGAAAVLRHAAQTLGNASLEARALGLADTFVTAPLESNGVCHGEAGRVLGLRQRARWTRRAGHVREADEALERFRERLEAMPLEERQSDLLEGLTGFGLVLLDAGQRTGAPWLRALCLSTSSVR